MDRIVPHPPLHCIHVEQGTSIFPFLWGLPLLHRECSLCGFVCPFFRVTPATTKLSRLGLGENGRGKVASCPAQVCARVLDNFRMQRPDFAYDLRSKVVFKSRTDLWFDCSNEMYFRRQSQQQNTLL